MSVPTAKSSRRRRKASTARHLGGRACELRTHGEPGGPMVTWAEPRLAPVDPELLRGETCCAMTQDELPSGTVTLLFTDIEGSTRLVKQLRDGYGEVLADHRRLLRAAFDAHGGREIDTQGDAFFVAFPRAKGAVAAAVDGQIALAGHAWPDGPGGGADGPAYRRARPGRGGLSRLGAASGRADLLGGARWPDPALERHARADRRRAAGRDRAGGSRRAAAQGRRSTGADRPGLLSRDAGVVPAAQDG